MGHVGGVYDGSKMKNFKQFYDDSQNVKELEKKEGIIFPATKVSINLKSEERFGKKFKIFLCYLCASGLSEFGV